MFGHVPSPLLFTIAIGWRIAELVNLEALAVESAPLGMLRLSRLESTSFSPMLPPATSGICTGSSAFTLGFRH